MNPKSKQVTLSFIWNRNNTIWVIRPNLTFTESFVLLLCSRKTDDLSIQCYRKIVSFFFFFLPHISASKWVDVLHLSVFLFITSLLPWIGSMKVIFTMVFMTEPASLFMFCYKLIVLEVVLGMTPSCGYFK